MSDSPSSQPVPGAVASTAELDFSCRLPLLVLFVSAAVWLVIASAFGLIASLKFHHPGFMADCACLTYGRVHAAYSTSLHYGFCLQAGLGFALWLIVRLGQATLAQRGMVTLGAKFWNLGVTIGVGGILAGDSTGFDNLEMPSYAALVVFLGYLLMGLWAVVTFHQRRERPLYVSQWFLFAALFWFPWIYSTAYLLLTVFPVRGVAQAVLAWWYGENLLVVWLSLVGLAAVFYFVPKLTNRDLHSRYLAQLTFWLLLLFASWGGIPSTAPVPAWMPVSSTIATVLTAVPLMAVALNIFRTTGFERFPAAGRSLPFVTFGVAAFVAAGFLRIAAAVLDTRHFALHFTWFAPAEHLLQSYGFFTMVMFGAAYYILPQLTSTPFPYVKLVRAHLWLAVLGVLFYCVPLALGGVFEAVRSQNATIPFTEVSKGTLPFLRASTVGDLLLLLGHLCFLANVVGVVVSLYRVKAAAAYAVATADLFKTAEAKS